MTFSWDPSSTPECSKTSSSSPYTEAAPVWNEFMQELDETSPATRKFGIGILKGGLIELKSRKAKRALPFCEGGPNGSIISSKVKCQSKNQLTRNKAIIRFNTVPKLYCVGVPFHVPK